VGRMGWAFYFGEKRLTVAIFLDVAKAFDNVWLDDLILKLAILNFASYVVKIIPSYLHNRTLEVSFQSATSTRRCMRAGVAQGGLVSPCALPPVGKRHTFAIPPRRAGPLRGRHRHHSHVPQASAAHQVLGILSE
jgi:hypothetical protein